MIPVDKLHNINCFFLDCGKVVYDSARAPDPVVQSYIGSALLQGARYYKQQRLTKITVLHLQDTYPSGLALHITH